MRYTGPQIAAAMALSGLTQERLALEAGIGRNTLHKIVNGALYRDATIAKITAVLERHGIEFTPAEGVRKRSRLVSVHESADAYQRLLDDIYATLADTGGEVLIAFVDETKGIEIASREFLHKHLERLHKAGITERLLVREGDPTMIAPMLAYHAIPDRHFSPHQVYIYGGRIAHLARLDPPKAIIIDDERFAGSMRGLFEFVWANTHPPSRKVSS